jgi:prophage DNA circulation protein
MSWRDTMGPASFRGAQFFVDTSELSGGRRGVTHEYPFRDKPFREDTGQAARTFTVEGYILGPDYFPQRRALETALQEPGTGPLVHPYHGNRTVSVTSFRVSERRQDGGICYISVEFVETPEEPAQPTATPDTAGQLTTTASAAREAVGAEFLARYAPGARMETLVDMPRRLAVAISQALAAVDQEAQAAAELQRQLDELVASAAALVQEPADILAAVSELFDVLDSRAVVTEAYAFDPGVRPPETTPNRIVEGENFDALQQVSQRLAVVRAAELALTETFESYEGAVSVRDELLELLDEQAELATDDSFPALMDLRAALVDAVPGVDSDLPRLLPYTPVETMPSLVLSWELYGNVTGEADIVARNRVKHPAFLLGGVELEVLSEA